MTGLCGKFAAKLEGTDRRRILVAGAVRRKRFVRDGHEIVGRFAAKFAKTESVFAECFLDLKPEVLQDDGLIHESRHFLSKGSRKLDLGASWK